jgi:hypothetical protein
VKPSDTLRESPPPASEVDDAGNVINPISVADWFFMATLRDTENEIFAVDAMSGTFVMGVSTPWEMKGWIRELLGFSEVEFESSFVTGEVDALKMAGEAWAQGGVAFLMIDANLLKADKPTIAFEIPEHWVTFQGNLKIEGAGEKITFDCHSWTKIHTIVTDEDEFEDHMFGVVTGVN